MSNDVSVVVGIVFILLGLLIQTAGKKVTSLVSGTLIIAAGLYILYMNGVNNG